MSEVERQAAEAVFRRVRQERQASMQVREPLVEALKHPALASIDEQKSDDDEETHPGGNER